MKFRDLILAPFIAAALAAFAPPALAAGDAEHPHDYAFSFDGPLGTYSGEHGAGMASIQRGFQVYKQVCASCHSMDHLAYRHLGEPGGPFAAYRVRNHETGDVEMRVGAPHGAHGARFVPVTENPYVRQIASEVMIADIDPNTGEAIERPGRPSDHFRRPFPNVIAAAAANGGAPPPDLSVITSARHGGADYIHALLTGYTGESEGTLWINPYFPGHKIAMPPPLAEGMVTYEDGTPATVEQMSVDVTAFLQWAADPHMEQRKSLGLQVLAFLALLSILLYVAYKQVWRGESH